MLFQFFDCEKITKIKTVNKSFYLILLDIGHNDTIFLSNLVLHWCLILWELFNSSVQPSFLSSQFFNLINQLSVSIILFNTRFDIQPLYLFRFCLWTALFKFQLLFQSGYLTVLGFHKFWHLVELSLIFFHNPTYVFSIWVNPPS